MQNYRKYITSGQSDKKWSFEVTTVGSASVKPNKGYPNNTVHPDDHSFTWDRGRILNGYYIIYVTRGEGILETARTRSYRVKAGHCFFLFPGVWHRYRPDARIGWEEYWVGFRGQYPDMLMSAGVISIEEPFIDIGLNEDVLDLFHQLIRTIQSASPGYIQIAAGVTLQLLGCIKALSKYRVADDESRLISKAKFILQETIDSPIHLEDLARELPMGYSKFRQLFKHSCGISPNQYQLGLRLDKAMELLLTTCLSISEVCYQTGFESIYYFSRLFKHKTGLSPKAYRSLPQHSDQNKGQAGVCNAISAKSEFASSPK